MLVQDDQAHSTMHIVILDSDPATGSSQASSSTPAELDFHRLRELGTLHVYPYTEPEQILERSRSATILLTNKVPLREETLAQLPQLRLISVLATGTDAVDVHAAQQRGITVCNVPGYSTASTAQMTIALLLELCHQVGAHSEHVKLGGWTEAARFSYWKYPLLELDGLTLGVVGWGAIGSRVASIAHSLGLRILIHTRTPPSSAPFPVVSKEELLQQCDIVSLHCPLTEHTRHWIDESALQLMKPGALLLNVARGPLLDSPAVARALHSGKLGGLAVDVLDQEPPPLDHPLLHTPHTIITPHIAWATTASRQRLLDITYENIVQFLQNTPQNVVQTHK